MGDDPKVCLVCGIDTNKKARHDRYNLPPSSISKRKSQAAMIDSDSDSHDSTSKSSKRSANQRSPRVAATSSGRQTRNQNPKSFAASMCKVMQLPATPEHPFLEIFSVAHYCVDCMTRVKEVHAGQMELEKIQDRLSEARVDFELDLSKHLQKIPFCKNVLRTNTFDRYKEDITLILDFHDPKKKKQREQLESMDVEEEDVSEKPPFVAALKLKRKAASNGAKEGDKTKVKKEEVVAVSSDEIESSSIDDDSANGKSAPDNLEAEIEEEGEVVKPEEAEPPAPEEVKPEPKVVKQKVKKDPNLKCPHCTIPRHFQIPQSLEDHIKKCHNRPFACDVCERKFQTERDVQRHKETVHEGESSYVCGFCDQPFKQKRYLEDHLDQHPQAKPLNCQYCGRTFKRLESLQKGFQIYKGEPVDPCRHCNRNLNLKDYLEHNRNLSE